MYRPEAKVDAAGSLGAGAAPSRSRCRWVGSRRADPGRPQAKEILLGIQPAAFMAGMQPGAGGTLGMGMENGPLKPTRSMRRRCPPSTAPRAI